MTDLEAVARRRALLNSGKPFTGLRRVALGAEREKVWAAWGRVGGPAGKLPGLELQREED